MRRKGRERTLLVNALPEETRASAARAHNYIEEWVEVAYVVRRAAPELYDAIRVRVVGQFG